MTSTPASMDKISKEWLEMVLSNCLSQKFTVKNFTVKPGSKKGDNFVGKLAAVDVISEEGDDFNLMIKFSPEAEFVLKFFRDCLLFEKEELLYQTLQKDLHEFQMKHYNKILFELPIPKCYYTHSEENGPAVIIMENLRSQGYKMHDKNTDFDFPHISLVLKGIAKFHALSFAYKTIEGIDLLEKYAALKDTFLQAPESVTFLNKALDTLKSILKNIKGQEHLIKRIEKYAETHDLSERYHALVTPIEPFAMITHGDFWNNNMMFKYAEENCDPIDYKILDLQICRYSSPNTDLAYLFYSSTGGDFRDKHLTEALQIYFDSFMGYLKLMNVDFGPDNYSFEDFMKDFDSKVELGFILASIVVPIILSTGDSIPDFADVQEDNVQQFMDDWNQKLFDHANDQTKKRILSLVEEIARRNII